MDSKQIFDKYRSRLVKEGVIKALLCGLAIGLGVAAVLTLVFWIVDFKYFWIGAIIGVAIIAAVAPMFYYWLFRPTTKAVAHRADRYLGLEERILTMTELENDDSYIAQRQREDAKAALVAAKSARLALRVPTKLIAVASAVALAYIPIQTIGILSYKGEIPKALEIAEQMSGKETEYHTVSYLCFGDGIIEGDPEQVVADGESASTVIAVADDGYLFLGWLDGDLDDAYMAYYKMALGWDDPKSILFSTDPVLTEENITEDRSVVAMFVMMSEDGNPVPGDGDGDGEGNPGDGDPGAPSDGQGNGQAGNGEQLIGDGNSAGGGESKQDDTFIDGKTPLKDYYEQYYEEAMKLLSEGKELPEDLRQIIEGYFGGLHP